jgi:hypothetical protein
MARKNPPVLKSVAIHQLRSLAVELKKTPTVADIAAGARRKKCPPVSTLRTLFGTTSGALRAARLPQQRNQEFTEQQLIGQLQDLSGALRRPITRRDVKKAGKAGTCARLATFRRVFGNSINAFRKAGVMKLGRFTREEIIDQYRMLHKDLGKLPTYFDIHRAAAEGKCAGYKVFRDRCGTLEQLRRAAGFIPRQRQKYTRQQMLDQLRLLTVKLKRTPLARELIEASGRGECATIETFRRYFGTYNNALSAAGLRIRPRAYSRDQLLHSLRELARRLGHRPTARDVNQASQRGECPSAKTYDNWFGRLSAAIHEARLDNMRARRTPRKSRRP